MKNLYTTSLLTAALFSALSLSAQIAQNGQNSGKTAMQPGMKASQTKYVKCTKFFVSKPLSELPDAKYVQKGEIKEAGDKLAEQYDKLIPKPKPQPFSGDPIVQTAMGVQALDTPLVNFNGIPTALDPPDPDGAVGPNYFVQADNMNIAVYSKTGAAVMGPKDLGYLWDSTSEVGDPIVMYDRFADRWFISQLYQDAMGYWELGAAVSTTNNPTGTYYTYIFFIGGLEGQPSSLMPDYPKYSIWTDGYYCTCRFFSGTGTQFVLVLERNRMLAGSPSAGMMSDSLPSSHSFSGNNRLTNAPKTLDCEGPLPPYGTPNYLFFFENLASGGPSNSIVIYKISTDTSTKVITSSVYDSLPTATFNAYFNGGSQYTNISQPGMNESIDDLDGCFNYRVPFRSFVGYNAVVLCNTVNLGNLVAGIRWYELHQDQVTKKFTIYQQGTYGPADAVSRWNASIDMDDNGNIGLAYNVSDSLTTYPGIRYTGRLASDPLGQMTFTERTAISGAGTWNGWRWGDYSQTTLDPSDGITFWHTNEFVDDSNLERTRIFSFKLQGTAGLNEAKTPNGELNLFQSGAMLNVVATSLPNNEKVIVNLFDINGKQLTSEWVVPQAGKIENQINVENYAAGTYLVRIGNEKFQLVKKVIIN